MGNNSSVLLVRKNPGLTSFVSLASVKRLVDPKVGHTGTLDKFAQGLLVVLTGSMTRLNPLFLGLDKKYHVEDVLKVGQQVPVKLIEIDRQNRLNLSYIDALDPKN